MSAGVEIAAGPLVDRHEHVRRITAAWQKTVANIVETGRLLIEAKDDIGFGGFQEMIRAELPFGPGTAQRLMQIAEDRVLSNAAHAPHLPASWMTLYELAKLPKHGLDLEVLIEDGTINPRMERKDVRALLPAPEQREDDLPPDYEGSAEPEAETAKPEEKKLKGDKAVQLAAATAKAEELIDAIGIDVIKRVLAALDEPGVSDALRKEIRCRAMNGPAAEHTETSDRWIESDTL
jgi:hypothetical protein